jgi:predicted ATP-grasp superfamily ATP-dependent carboligase
MTTIHLKPAVPKQWLIAIAGLVWAAAGIMLGRLAWTWLRAMPALQAVGLAAAGGVLAIVFHRVLLRRLARRNMARIDNYADRGCVFAFQAWRSYLVILLMIAMGSFLRHTALPREILSLLYTAMGGGLLLSSLGYFHLFGKLRRRGAICSGEDDDRPGPTG